MPGTRVWKLIVKELKGEISETESIELNDWISASESNRRMYEAVRRPSNIVRNLIYQVKGEAIRDRVKGEIYDRMKQETTVRTMRPWYRQPPAIRSIAAVAAVLLITVGIVVRYRVSNSGNIKVIAALQNDATPAKDRAVLTTGNGQRIFLDSAKNGVLTRQGSTTVTKMDSGMISYQSPQTNKEVLWNVITTPRSGKYKLVLADGTQVWLNAASSLRFPTAFAGSERQVFLTGEGYFDVAANSDAPFKVNTDILNVTVLGTRFDIMAYSDEKYRRATLLSGKIKVESTGSETTLVPDQEASMTEGEPSLKISDRGTSAEESIAWMENLFVFNHSDLQSTLRQLSRWYDVDFELQNNPTHDYSFEGTIGRDKNLSVVLHILEVNRITFKIEGKKILVYP